MGIFSRIKNVFCANANAALDNLEKSGAMIDQTIRNIEDDLKKVETETANVMAEKKSIEFKITECDKEIEKMHNFAKKALQAGNEDDARAFLEKEKTNKEKKVTYTATLESLTKSAESMEQTYNNLYKKVQEYRVKKEQLKAQLAVAETQKRLQKLNSDLGSSVGDIAKFDQLEESINKEINKAAALSELQDKNSNKNIETIVSKYTDSSIDEDLAALKNELDNK